MLHTSDLMLLVFVRLMLQSSGSQLRHISPSSVFSAVEQRLGCVPVVVVSAVAMVENGGQRCEDVVVAPAILMSPFH